MNSRTRETLVALRALRLFYEYRFPKLGSRKGMLHAAIVHAESEDLASIVLMAMDENESQAREEIRRELGEEVDGVATISSETLRERTNDGEAETFPEAFCRKMDETYGPLTSRAGEPDADPRTSTPYGDLEL